VSGVGGIIGGIFSAGFADRLEEKILADISQRQIEIGNGFCQNYEDYRFACGFIEGLRKAQEIMDELKQEIGGHVG
jgi:hypothetical protein